MSILLSSITWLLQAFAFFIGLTIYGSMWKGAQDHGQRGWVVALIWAIALMITVQSLKALHLLTSLRQ
jgi:hypothetical protein